MKDKKGETVTEAFKTIFKEGRKPQYPWTDRGKEYYNKHMKKQLEKNGKTLYSTENEEKSSVCDRWNRTIKTKVTPHYVNQYGCLECCNCEPISESDYESDNSSGVDPAYMPESD